MSTSKNQLFNHVLCFSSIITICFICFSFSSKNSIQNRPHSKDIVTAQQKKIEYYTNNIFNNKYIIPLSNWPFNTDPKGEDLFSEYGKPFNETIIVDEVKGEITLANQKMTLRSNVFNNSDQQLFIDNILLSIEEKIEYPEVHIGNGNWKTRDFENTCSFLLTEGKNKYQHPDVHIDLKSKGYAFFKFDIQVDPSLIGKITRYKIKLSLADGRGKRYQIESDKTYLIGCYY